MKRRIEEYFSSLRPTCRRVGVLLSGGVDSALVTWAAKRVFGDEVAAFFCVSPLAPDDDRLCAEQVAKTLGLSLICVATDPLGIDDVRRNLPTRCYACRKGMHEKVACEARRREIDRLFDGANADDLESSRPGMRAAREDGILSPLRECGIPKDDVRRMAREVGLAVWNRPSAPCLATRFPAGVPIEDAWLDKVRRGEAALRQEGFRDFRLRCFPPGAAVLEVSREELERVWQGRDRVVALLREIGFPVATLDLEGLANGKMDRFLADERGAL